MSSTRRSNYQEWCDLSRKLYSLQDYINRRMGHINQPYIAILRDQINEACRLFPTGADYNMIVANLQKFLPETIDSALRVLLETCKSLKFLEKSHIISETTVILMALKTFRNHRNFDGTHSNMYFVQL